MGDGFVGAPYNPGSDTSRDAAESIVVDAYSLREQVYSHVLGQGFYGSTCDEIEAGLNMRHQTASARVNELHSSKRIADTGRRRPTRSKRMAAVWVALDRFPYPATPETDKLNTLRKRLGVKHLIRLVKWDDARGGTVRDLVEAFMQVHGGAEIDTAALAAETAAVRAWKHNMKEEPR